MRELLGVYLNDHLAGATGGVELSRRLARAHRQAADGQLLRGLADDIAADRKDLLVIFRKLSVPVRQYKIQAAWLAEKAGRLKLNGRLLNRSPLSDLVELEALRLGVEGKAALWRTLLVVATSEPRLPKDRLEELHGRAGDQATTLERLRAEAVERLFAAQRE